MVPSTYNNAPCCFWELGLFMLNTYDLLNINSVFIIGHVQDASVYYIQTEGRDEKASAMSAIMYSFFVSPAEQKEVKYCLNFERKYS